MKKINDDFVKAKKAISDAKIFGCDWEDFLEENIAILLKNERNRCLEIIEFYKHFPEKSVDKIYLAIKNIK